MTPGKKATQATSTTVVIACHNPRRPIRRAVNSILVGNRGTEVIVVAHNTDAQLVRDAICTPGLPAAPRAPGLPAGVQVVELRDQIASAAGPFNYGLSLVNTEFASIMGSDDVLEPGAIAAWQGAAQRTGARVVLGRVHRGLTHPIVVRTPPVRPRPRPLADFVRDRLVYRSAPLGIMHTQTLHRLGLSFTEGLATGEDIPFSAQLYLQTPLCVQRFGPGYLVGEDAVDRTTLVPRPLETELAHVKTLLTLPLIRELPGEARLGVAAKTLRVHLFGAIVLRPTPAPWTAEERRVLARITREILAYCPQVRQVLSLSDHRLIEVAANSEAKTSDLLAASARRRHFLHPRCLISARPVRSLHREAPLRFNAASLLVR